MATEEEWRQHAYDVEQGRRGNPSFTNTSGAQGYREYEQVKAREAASNEAFRRGMEHVSTGSAGTSVPVPDAGAAPKRQLTVGQTAGSAVKTFAVVGALIAAIAAWVNTPGAWPQVITSAIAGALAGTVLFGVFYVLALLVGIAVKIVVFLVKVAFVVALIGIVLYMLTHAG